MSRKKGEELNADKPYTELEYMYIFFAHIRGLDKREVARSLDREEVAMDRCWRRLCQNGTDHPNKKIYNLEPFSDKPWPHINGYAEQYVDFQMHIVEVTSSARKISEQTGIPLDMVRDYINKLSETPRKKEQNLLV